jgi:hypothetical protein
MPEFCLTQHSLQSSALHPGLRLEYFCQQDWEEEWIDNAENLVREEYIIRYEGKSSIVIPTLDATNSVSW